MYLLVAKTNHRITEGEILKMTTIEKDDVQRLDLEADAEKTPDLLTFIDEQFDKLNVSIKERMRIFIVVEELFVNIASYAYKHGKGMATILTRASKKDNSLEITFVDSGIPFNPIEKEDPDTTLAAEDRKQGGLGIYITKKRVDEISYCYENNQNRLTIKKHFTADRKG